jgi:AraC-like DNA-binding protein
VTQLQQIQSKRPASALQNDADVVTREAGTTAGRQLTLVQRAVWHVHQQYQSPALSLTAVAESLGCNPKYLTSCFTRTVGERMHLYVVRLRVAHACRLLIDANMPIKAIAYEAGFRGNGALARAFRRHVGVAPGEYRRIFGAH